MNSGFATAKFAYITVSPSPLKRKKSIRGQELWPTGGTARCWPVNFGLRHVVFGIEQRLLANVPDRNSKTCANRPGLVDTPNYYCTDSRRAQRSVGDKSRGSYSYVASNVLTQSDFGPVRGRERFVSAITVSATIVFRARANEPTGLDGQRRARRRCCRYRECIGTRIAAADLPSDRVSVPRGPLKKNTQHNNKNKRRVSSFSRYTHVRR